MSTLMISSVALATTREKTQPAAGEESDETSANCLSSRAEGELEFRACPASNLTQQAACNLQTT